jgi:hypothetical protein
LSCVSLAPTSLSIGATKRGYKMSSDLKNCKFTHFELELTKMVSVRNVEKRRKDIGVGREIERKLFYILRVV